MVFALLWTLHVLAFTDRFVLAAVLPRIEEELHLSHATAGLLGTLFLVGYLAASPAVGWLADRGHERAVLCACTVVWSLGTIASGLAPGVVWLAAGRVLVGAAEASIGVVAPEIVDRVAPPHRRSSWLGLFYVAANVGVALGLALGGIVGHRAGWRAAFLVAGAPGIVLALLCLAIDLRSAAAPLGGRRLGEGLGLLRRPRYARIVAGYAAYLFAIGAFGHWAPALCSRRFDLGLETTNLGLGAVSLTGGVAGAFLGGVLGDRITKGHDAGDGRARALVRCAAGACTLAAPLAAAAILAPTWPGLLAMLFACQLTLLAASAPLNGAVLHSAPPAERAGALALAVTCAHVFGDLGSPSIVGKLADVITLDRAMLILPFAIAAGAALWWTAARP